mmetsp:Transcript_963/g.887  ORF Transcript_963/g.887 Transcript_963/m.887 type:complete len:80 (-) Transcript_963:4520-4759(-)
MFGAYFSFQLIALLDEDDADFFGLSAVFLTLNSIIMTIIAFITFSERSASIFDIFAELKKIGASEYAVDTKYGDLPLPE